MSKQHPHIKTLRAHNKWRRGDERVKMGDPKDIGIAIDWAVKVSELAEKFEVSKWAIGRICRYERRAQTPANFKNVHVLDCE